MDPEIIIGDKVRLINAFYVTKRDYPLLFVDDEGIVVHILGTIKLDPQDGNWKDSRKIYYIDWGKPINGHDCGGRCQDGHGSNVEREEVKVL